MIIDDFQKEKMAGYISFENEVYSFAPKYIQEMAKEINKDYQQYYNRDYFTFVKSEDMFGINPPSVIKKIRQELEKQYIA